MARAARSTRARETGRVEQPSPAALSLLDEPLLGLELGHGKRRGATLPEALALLARDEVCCFTAMQAHQLHGWHAFLVQLAAIALHHAGEEDPKQKAERWRELLVRLTRSPEPWCLVVGDLAKPAFMQPPVPEGTLERFTEEEFPDELDVLVTAKNHDVKARRIAAPRPEHWIYALVTLQTMQGFFGQRNYGIARMNGGFASRPNVGLSPGLRPGVRFRRDVAVTLAARQAIAKAHGFPQRGGKALLWCEPWDGEESLSPADLDPLFIDVCRRVRMRTRGEQLVASRTGTSASRVAAEALTGNTGDPWTPVDGKEGKAFTASDSGFSYRVVQRLLGEYVPGAALVPQAREADCLLLCSVLARGQGKTAGFHERVLPVPRAAATLLRRDETRADLGRLARERVDLVATVQNRALRPALKVLLQGAPAKLEQDDDRPAPWVRAHDAAVDAEFFERLWADLERDPEDAARAWALRVIELARTQLHAAFDDAPVPSARRFRAIAAAEHVFEGAVRNHVTIAFPQREVSHAG